MTRLAWIFVLVLASAGAARAEDICWRNSSGRGVGAIPGQCEMFQDQSGLLCYPQCRSGFSGVSFVCWQDCPAEFRDDGAFCAKPAPYGRGAGYPWQFGDGLNLDGAIARCESQNRATGCEKSGEIIYPRCRAGFHAVGCCTCSPDCPSTMTDSGVSCAKQSYTRQTILPSCPAGQDYDAGLCYPKCPAGFSGVGPVCWAQCPASMPVDCGASCARSQDDCAKAVTDQVMSVLDAAANIALTVATAGAGTAAKAAVTTGGKAAVKVGAQAAARTGARQGLKATARRGLKKLTRQEIKTSLRTARDDARRAGRKEAEDLTEERLEKLAEVLDLAQSAGEQAEDGPDPMAIAEIMDPTGLIAIVNAYNRPLCSDVAAGHAPAAAPASVAPPRPVPGAVVCAPAAPTAAALEPGMLYRLTNAALGEGRSLDIANEGRKDHPVMAATGAFSGQTWKVTPQGDGHYRLTTAWQGDGRSLDIANDGRNDTPILSDTGGYSGQMWTLSPAAGGLYRLTTAWQGDCKSLDASGGTLRLAPGTDQPGQLWKLTPTGQRY
jgi:hypothetical protein